MLLINSRIEIVQADFQDTLRQTVQGNTCLEDSLEADIEHVEYVGEEFSNTRILDQLYNSLEVVDYAFM